jgi:DNA-directed RNA polymerase I subunit RPA1
MDPDSAHHSRQTQVKKYIARLQLLDHGLLTASFEVDQITPHTRPRSTREIREFNGDAGDVDEEGGDDQEIPVESYEDYAARIDDFVKFKIEESMSPNRLEVDEKPGQSSSGTSQKSKGRDGYKDGLVYAERKNVLRDFGKKAYTKCACCGA